MTQPCSYRPQGLGDLQGKGSTLCPLSSAHMIEHSQEENFSIFIRESRRVVIGTLSSCSISHSKKKKKTLCENHEPSHPLPLPTPPPWPPTASPARHWEISPMTWPRTYHMPRPFKCSPKFRTMIFSSLDKEWKEYQDPELNIK